MEPGDYLLRQLPRPRHRAGRRLRAAPRDGRAVRQGAPASRAATAARCTCSTSSATSSAAGASSAASCRSPSAPRSRSTTESEPNAVLCQLGEGATNIGAFHESLNLAAIWDLPIVFQVINNRYGMGTSRRGGLGRARAVEARRGLPHARRARRRQRPAGRARGRRPPAARAPARSASRRCWRRRPTASAGTRWPTRARSTARRTRSREARSATRSTASLRLRSRASSTPRTVDAHAHARSTTRSTPRSARRPRIRRPIPANLFDNVYGDADTGASSSRRMARGGAVRRAGGDAFMADLTYREALRRALDEELRATSASSSWARRSAASRAPTRSPRACRRSTARSRVRETPIAEEGFVGAGIGAAMLGLRPVVEIMTINFILVAMDMVVNHAAKVRQMFGGKVGVPLVIRTPGRRRRAAHGAALAEPRGDVRAHAGPEGRGAVDAARRLRPAEDGDPRRRPGAVRREPRALQRQRRAARAGRRLHGADRPRAGRARGHAT